MNIREAAVVLVKRLQEAGVPYLLVGSFSSNLYGIPRSTKDVDVVIQAKAGALMDLSGALGEMFEPVDQFRFETNTGTFCQEFKIRGTTFRVELFMLSDDHHDTARFDRRRAASLDGETAFFPSAEDVIIWKLRWARSKDIDDIIGILLVQSREGNLDWSYMREWCAKHGTLARLEEIVAGLPKPK